VFVNIEDTSELVAFDPQKLTVKSRWKLANCEEPTGLAIDRKNAVYLSAVAETRRWLSSTRIAGKCWRLPPSEKDAMRPHLTPIAASPLRRPETARLR